MPTNDGGVGGQGTPAPIESNVNLDNILNGNTHQGVPDVIIPPAGDITNPEPPSSLPTTGNPPTGEPTVPQTPAEPQTVSVDTFDGLLKGLANPQLAVDLEATKTELLATFKASSIDDKGNLLNDKGEVVVTSETLKSFIDEDKLPMDDKGNLINAKGEVIKSKEDIAQENSIIAGVKSSIETNFGINLGALTDLPETEEGIIKLVEEAVKVKSTNAVKDFLSAVPEVKSFYQHLALGGRPEDYTSSNIDYKAINVKNLEESAKLDLLNKSFTLQGTPNKDGLIDLIKKAGDEEVNKAVASAIVFLDAKQTETNASRDAQLAAQAKAEEQATIKYWTDVKQVVDNGKLANISIPVTEREAFFAYMSKPVTEEGDSAEYLDSLKDSTDFNLMVSYLRFKKGDISKLVTNLAKETKVETLRERMKRLNSLPGNGVPITETNHSGKGGNGNISLENLLS